LQAVRFADALGLDLESVRHILDVSDAPSIGLGRSTAADVASAPRLRLVARFSEPGTSADFLRRVQERKVSLEEISVNNDSVSGVVRVANIAYHKQVRCLAASYVAVCLWNKTPMRVIAAAPYGVDTSAKYNRERKCADTNGTVLVPSAGHSQC